MTEQTRWECMKDVQAEMRAKTDYTGYEDVPLSLLSGKDLLHRKQCGHLATYSCQLLPGLLRDREPSYQCQAIPGAVCIGDGVSWRCKYLAVLI